MLLMILYTLRYDSKLFGSKINFKNAKDSLFRSYSNNPKMHHDITRLLFSLGSNWNGTSKETERRRNFDHN